MDLSSFIFNGQFQKLKIGSNIQNLRMPFYKVTDENEDGDMPSLYNLEGENEDFQFAALKDNVVGISFDFQYEPEKFYTISVEELKLELGYKTSLESLIVFLAGTNLDYEIHSESENFEVKFKTNGVLLSFSKNNLIKASIFDSDLYEKISNLEY